MGALKQSFIQLGHACARLSKGTHTDIIRAPSSWLQFGKYAEVRDAPKYRHHE